MLAANRRRSERRLCRRIAKIQTGAGSLPRDCTITDISDGGVKVVAGDREYLYSLTLPELWMSPDAPPAYTPPYPPCTKPPISSVRLSTST